MTAQASKHIQFSLAIPTEVQCEYTGIPQGEYYTDLDKAIKVCERFPDTFESATGFRPAVSYPTPVTAYEGVAALGGELVFPKDHQPMLANQGRIITDVEQIDSLTVPDPDSHPRFRHILTWHGELNKRFGDFASPGIAGQEGPITTAVLLRGQDFFLDCLDDPARAHKLLDLCTEMFILWNKRSRDADRIPADIAAICDDHSGLLGPDFWDEFVIPYYARITEELGPNGLWLHTELVTRNHLPHLRALDLVGVNFAEDQYLKIEDVFEILPGIPFGWHILTVSEMQQGTPELIQSRCEEIIETGVDEIRCELTVNTPPENIRAFLDMKRKFQRTPVNGTNRT